MAVQPRDVGVVAAMYGSGPAGDYDRPGAYGRHSDARSEELVGTARLGRPEGRHYGRGRHDEYRAGRREHRHHRRGSLAEAGDPATRDRRSAARNARTKRAHA